MTYIRMKVDGYNPVIICNMNNNIIFSVTMYSYTRVKIDVYFFIIDWLTVAGEKFGMCMVIRFIY